MSLGNETIKEFLVVSFDAVAAFVKSIEDGKLSMWSDAGNFSPLLSPVNKALKAAAKFRPELLSLSEFDRLEVLAFGKSLFSKQTPKAQDFILMILQTAQDLQDVFGLIKIKN